MAEPEGKHWGLGLIQSKQKSTARFQQAVLLPVLEGAFIRWEPVGVYRPHHNLSYHLSILTPMHTHTITLQVTTLSSHHTSVTYSNNIVLSNKTLLNEFFRLFVCKYSVIML